MSFDPMNYNPQNNDTTIYDLLAFFFGGIWISLKLIVSLSVLAFSGLAFIAIFFFDRWHDSKARRAHADRTP